MQLIKKKQLRLFVISKCKTSRLKVKIFINGQLLHYPEGQTFVSILGHSWVDPKVNMPLRGMAIVIRGYVNKTISSSGSQGTATQIGCTDRSWTSLEISEREKEIKGTHQVEEQTLGGICLLNLKEMIIVSHVRQGLLNLREGIYLLHLREVMDLFNLREGIDLLYLNGGYRYVAP